MLESIILSKIHKEEEKRKRDKNSEILEDGKEMKYNHNRILHSTENEYATVISNSRDKT